MVSQSTENLRVQFNEYLLVQLIRLYLVSLVLSAVMDNTNGLTHISRGRLMGFELGYGVEEKLCNLTLLRKTYVIIVSKYIRWHTTNLHSNQGTKPPPGDVLGWGQRS